MLEESLICQRVVYDALQECDKEIYEIEFDQELRKSCLLSYQKYKEEMKRKTDEVKTYETLTQNVWNHDNEKTKDNNSMFQ